MRAIGRLARCNGTTLTAGRRRLNILVIVQVALSMVLLISGAVAIRSSAQSLVADAGYETQHVFDLNFRFPETTEYNDTRKAVLVAQVRAQTAAQPGVTAVTSALPPDISAFQTAAAPLMETSAEGASRILYYSHVQANYFETVGIPLTRGVNYSRTWAPDMSMRWREWSAIRVVERSAAALRSRSMCSCRRTDTGLSASGAHHSRPDASQASFHWSPPSTPISSSTRQHFKN